MKFGVVTFPGSNCDDDMIYVLEQKLGQSVVKLWHKDTDLQGVDCVVLPGGFSFGDYMRSGALAKLSPIMGSVIEHANKGGYVFGVCNGFQILTESGLLEGALLHNDKQKFICKNVFLAPANNGSAINKNLDTKRAYKIPIAHGEGRFYADDVTLDRLEKNNQVIFRYVDQNAGLNMQANPNGSRNNIAGICNANRNVFGMMPHPERASDAILGNTDGAEIFESLIANFK